VRFGLFRACDSTQASGTENAVGSFAELLWVDADCFLVERDFVSADALSLKHWVLDAGKRLPRLALLPWLSFERHRPGFHGWAVVLTNPRARLDSEQGSVEFLNIESTFGILHSLCFFQKPTL
jgi:hypothetical protein